jgi:hypothetical protein
MATTFDPTELVRRFPLRKTDTPTRLQQLTSERLGVPVAEFVIAHRIAGTSWRTIATEIEQRTGIEISHTGLRRWFAEPAFAYLDRLDTQTTAEPTGSTR